MRYTTSEPTKSIGIWIRVSTEDQVRGESPEHHEKRARAYAEAKGWHVADVYRLDAVSGKAIMATPEAKRMLTDIRAGTISGLVFSKLARLARNTKELLEFSEIFRACGADLISLAESIDTSTPAGRLFFTMIAAMAQWEREEIADRVKASVPIRAAMGKPTAGVACFGYRWVDKKLEPDPSEAPVRALVYELFAEHKRKKTVARLLNDRGYRTRKGAKFSDTTIVNLLRDPTAKGLRRANYTYSGENGTALRKPENEWVWTPVQAIVSEELWDRCNAIMDEQLTGRRPAARKAVHLFSGIASCHCGGKMYVWSNSPKYICAACRNKIPIPDLEAVYRDQLSHFLLSSEEIEAHNAAANEALREKEKLIEATAGELKRIAADEEQLFELYYARSLSKEDFGRRHRPLSERRTQLEDELPRLQAERDVVRISLLSQEEALSEARDLSARWADLEHEQKRQIVEAITERIIVGKEDVEIILLDRSTGTDANRATQSQGFMAAISCTRAG